MITKEQFAAAEREVAAIFQRDDASLSVPDRTEFDTEDTAAAALATESDFTAAQSSSAAEQRIARILQRVHAEHNC